MRKSIVSKNDIPFWTEAPVNVSKGFIKSFGILLEILLRISIFEFEVFSKFNSIFLLGLWLEVSNWTHSLLC